jgi:hypothetical protein
VRNIGLLVVASASLALAGCLATGPNTPVSSATPGTYGVDKPGTTVKVNIPDFNKWFVQQAGQTPPANPQAPQQASGKTLIYACKPMACPGAALVGVQMGPSPTRHPDRTALEKAAKLLPTQAKAQDLVADAASEGDIRITSLSSKVAEFRGYPAIIGETKRTTRGKTAFNVRGDIFIGDVLVKIVSQSTDRQEAKRNFDAFVAALEIKDIEPPATPAGREAAPVALDNPAAPVIQTRD